MNPVVNSLYAAFRNVGKAVVPSATKHQIFVDFCRHLGVSKVRVSSPYGDISGLIADRACFGTFMHRRIWAPEVNDLVVKFFQNTTTGTYLDIGANIGLTTIPTAKLGHVACHAFEPDPKNFALLAENVATNTPSGTVQLHNVALFSGNTELEFELSPTNHGDHRVRIGNKPSTESFAEHTRAAIKVRGLKLDEVLRGAGLPRPMFAKIDTEGCEAHVLAGGIEILQHADAMILEFWPYAMARADSDTSAMLNTLQQHFSFALAVDHNETLDVADLKPFAEVRPKLEAFVKTGGGTDRLELMVTKRKNILNRTESA